MSVRSIIVAVGGALLCVAAPSVAAASPATSAPPPTTAPAADDATADAEQTGPVIVLDRTELRPGEPVIVTLSGFTSQQVTVAVCGNLAKRGSEDCNMPKAQSERIRPDEPETLTQLFVEEPPMPCPCIIRALGGNGEFAIAPIDLIDHPIAPVVSPEFGPLVEVDIRADRVPSTLSSRIRTGLGGATGYSVTVSVRNTTTETLANVAVRARVASRFGDDVAPMRFDTPGPIEPGKTWSQTLEVELPAPFIGTFTWTASASGAGPIVDDTFTTDAVPSILYAFVGLLALDLVVLLARAVRRRRRRRRATTRRRTQPTSDSAPDATVVSDDREPVGVA